jgi:S1-C subfamily serine protease
MSKVFAALIAILATITLLPGCCHGVPADVQAGESLPNSNDFVKSVVMVSVDGTMTVELLGEKEKKVEPTGISASAVAIDKKHLLTAAHFCEPVLQGWSKQGIVQEQKLGAIVLAKATIKLKKNMKMTYLNNNEEVVSMDNVNIVTLDKAKDICLLERKGHGMVPAVIATPSTVHRGDKVYIVGAPLGVFPVKTEGEVAILSIHFEEKEGAKFNGRIIVTAPATNGNSGGPCFNVKGELVGLLIAGAEGYDHLSIVTPSKMILSFLKKFHKD